MTNFIGTDGNDVANAALGELTGFTGGSVADLQDGTGDFFSGGGGEDFVFAGNADDLIEGGEGHDTLNGGAGHDTIFGHTEPDPLGSLIGDEIVGNDGNDTLIGSSGSDSIDGGSDDDSISGNGGDDLIQGGINTDSLLGGDGNDTIYAYAVGSNNEGSFNFLNGGTGDDVLIGANGDDNLVGGPGADTLSGNYGDDNFFFSAGDVAPGEIIDGGLGYPSAGGGPGLDDIMVSEVVSFTDAASIVGIERVLLEAAGATAIFSAHQVKTLLPTGLLIDGHATTTSQTFQIEMGAETSLDIGALSFQQWDAMNDRVVIVGDGDDEFMSGTLQIDRLLGNAGDDTLVGDAGVDQLFGGLGNDVYLVDQAGGEAIELAGQGADTVLTFFNYTLAAQVENLTLLGTADSIGIGNGLANMMTGNAGDNILNGGAGVDLLQGGLGNDSYVVDHASDQVMEAANAGTDTVFSLVAHTLAADVERLYLSGTAAINGFGNALANTINGNSAANILNGGAGADILRGNLGNDTYFIDHASDVVFEIDGQGADTVIATTSYVLAAGRSVETLRTTGSASTYVVNLVGNELANTIAGNAAANLLLGKAGNDTLIGGGGNDTFRFDTLLGVSNIDSIIDYNAAQDTIQLENAIFTGLATGTLAANAFRVGTAAADADDRIIYNSATGALIFDSNGNGSGGAIQFATLTTKPAISAAELFVT
jgi:Ca2+-binding RTX toxin-like protein